MAVLRVPFKMLLEPAPHFRLGPNNTALLLMDAQHFTTTRGQGLGQLASVRGIDRELDDYFLQTEAALRNMAVLIAACRSHSVAVMHTILHCEHADRSDLSRQMRISGLDLPTGDPHQEIRPEVVPSSNEPVISRTTFSPFVSSDLEQSLRAAAIETILLAGMLANYTVWQTAREAADRGFGVIVVMDCSASETLEWHTQLRTGVVGGLIRQRSSMEVIEMLAGTRT